MTEARERWASRPVFIMAAVGSAIGLGNVWRFPGIAFNNGGGAFFIAYIAALLTAGIPLMIVEYGLGSRSQGAAPQAYKKLGRGLEWIGWWATLIGLGIAIYYCVILAWSWDYCWQCVRSIFTGELAWEPGQAKAYFDEHVIAKSSGPMDPGGFNTSAAIGLFITWAAVWWCIAKGVLRVGKIVMITVPLPLVLLAVLVLRGLTLDGAMDGLAYYLTPDWSKLLDSRTWVAAYGQVFFSLSVGWGILIAYSSYRSKDSDVVNNAFITSFANCGFSFLAGFAVFSTLGYLAFYMNQPIGDLSATTFGLAFTSYPTAIEVFPGGVRVQALLGFGFFLMLLTLGIDSAFSIVEATATAAYDKFRMNRSKLVIVLCATGFIFGLAFCFGSGIFWLDICDRFLAEYSLPLVALVQTIVLGWIIGRRKLQALQDDINRRSELKAGSFWKWSLKVVTPVMLAFNLFVVYQGLATKGYEGYSTTALLLAGGIPAGLMIILAFVLTFMKGARHEDP